MSILRNASMIADKFCEWQDEETGGLSKEKSGYHKPWSSHPEAYSVLFNWDVPFISYMLYRVYRAGAKKKYKQSADRYASCVVTKTLEIRKPPTGASYEFGAALWSLSQYKKENPKDTSLDEAALELYRLLIERRINQPQYFSFGYTITTGPDKGKDPGFSNDLTLMGLGLMGYYDLSRNTEALEHARNLSRYFTTEYQPGTAKGVWASSLGTWIVGPLRAIGWELLPNCYSDEVGWTPNHSGVMYLTQLYRVTKQPEVRKVCLSHLAWSLDKCQFDDGAIGAHARDDKWLGATGAAVTEYVMFMKEGMLDREYTNRYLPKVLKALEYLQVNSAPDKMPKDGYVRVTGESVPEPDCVVTMYLAWAAEGLLDGIELKMDQS